MNNRSTFFLQHYIIKEVKEFEIIKEKKEMNDFSVNVSVVPSHCCCCLVQSWSPRVPDPPDYHLFTTTDLTCLSDYRFFVAWLD